MKTIKGRVFLFISVITLASGLTWALKAQSHQMDIKYQEQEATLKLTKPEIEAIYSIIDDAPVAGQIRKPLLQKIEAAYTIAFAPKQPVKADTTKSKKN